MAAPVASVPCANSVPLRDTESVPLRKPTFSSVTEFRASVIVLFTAISALATLVPLTNFSSVILSVV